MVTGCKKEKEGKQSLKVLILDEDSQFKEFCELLVDERNGLFGPNGLIG